MQDHCTCIKFGNKDSIFNADLHTDTIYSTGVKSRGNLWDHTIFPITGVLNPAVDRCGIAKFSFSNVRSHNLLCLTKWNFQAQIFSVRITQEVFCCVIKKVQFGFLSLTLQTTEISLILSASDL